MTQSLYQHPRNQKNIAYKVLLFCLFFCSFHLNAQDVEGFFDELKDRAQNDPFKINGALSLTSSFGHISGISARRDPFNYGASANINFDVMGIKAPFNFSYSNGNSTYDLPSYQFYGISPSYKWITLHFGDRSMNFSPYSLSGHNFFGAGIELSPGKFKFSAMYGRLKRATAADLNSFTNFEPVYKRMGWGFKTGYSDGKDEIMVSLFSAADDPNSINTGEQIVKAKDNVVLEMNAKKGISKRLYVAFDIARSTFTNDQAAQDLVDENGVFKSYGGLIKPKLSTNHHHAYKGSIGFNASATTNFQFNYEKIAAGYRSLGSLFFNDDLENFTISSGTSLFNKKVNLTGSVGLQRDNLSGDESFTNNRFIGNINFNYTATERMIWNGTYSNFRNTNKVRSQTNPFAPVDSIHLVLVNENASLSLTNILGKNKQAALNTMIAYQKGSSILNEIVQDNQATDFVNASINYTYTFTESKLTFSSGIMANHSYINNFKTFFVAPNMAISKSFFEDKLKASASVAFSSVYNDGIVSARIWNFRAQSSYQFFEKHRLSLSIGCTQKSNLILSSESGFFESTGNVRYGYSF